MDKTKIDACIALVGSKGSQADICVLYTKLAENLKDHVIEFEMKSRQYLSELLEMINDGAFPFKFNKRYPKSVLYTASGLDILHETGVVDPKIIQKTITCLCNWQDPKGWWKDSTDLLEVNNLPFYQDPMDAAVRIFNTASVASILAKFKDETEVETSLNNAMNVLKTTISTNGSLIGFPQTTIFATVIFSHYFGLSSEEFNRHLTILNQMIDTSPTTGDIVTIGEQLISAGIDKSHEIVQKCRYLLEDQYSEQGDGEDRIGGWKTMKQYDPALTMRALIFLLDISD